MPVKLDSIPIAFDVQGFLEHDRLLMRSALAFSWSYFALLLIRFHLPRKLVNLKQKCRLIEVQMCSLSSRTKGYRTMTARGQME